MNPRHLLLTGLAAAVATTLATSQTVRPTQVIDGNPGTLNFDPVIASSGNISIAAFSETGVNVTSSDGTAKTWSTQVTVDSDTSGARKDLNPGDAQIVDGNVFLLWNDRRGGGTARDAFFATSADGGATWTADQPIDLGHGTLGIAQLRDWRLGVGSSGVPGFETVVIAGTTDPIPNPGANEELYINTSFDGGVTFGTAIHVPQGFAPGAVDIDEFDMVVVGQTVHIAWADDRNATGDDVWYQRSNDGGFTWLAADIQLSTPGSNHNDILDLDVNGSTVAVSWKIAGVGGDEAHANVSTDGGTTWNGDVTLGTPLAQIGSFSEGVKCTVTPSGNVVAAWDQGPDFGTDIAYTTSTDGGLTFAAPTILVGGGFPGIDSGNEYVVIISNDQGPGNDPLTAISSCDEGVTFGAQFDVADNTGDIDRGRIAFNDLYDNAVICWHADDLGGNDTYGTGFRPQTVTATGWQDLYNPTETLLGFDATDWGSSQVVFIVLAAAPGPSAIPDGRFEDIGPDFINTLGAFFTIPIINCNGSTGVFPNPFAGQPPLVDGMTPIQFAGVGFGGIPAAEARFSETQIFNI